VTRTDAFDRTVAQLGEHAGTILRAEQTPERDGFLQAVHPNLKVAGLFGLIVFAVALDDAVAFAALLAVAGSLALASRVPPRQFLGRIAVVPLLSLVVVAPQLVLLPGEPVVASLPVTVAGAAYVVTFVLRVAVAVAFLSLLLLTTRFATLIAALRRFRVPTIAITLLAITHRYLLVFFDELTRMVRARRSRTLPDTDRSLRESWRETGNLLGTFLLRTIDRGERVERAARARGGSRMRPYDRSEPMGPADAIFVATVVTAVTLGVILA
jgi:cobalt/nickel transport system permease protein